jgi:hypothetical protein
MSLLEHRPPCRLLLNCSQSVWLLVKMTLVKWEPFGLDLDQLSHIQITGPWIHLAISGLFCSTPSMEEYLPWEACVSSFPAKIRQENMRLQSNCVVWPIVYVLLVKRDSSFFLKKMCEVGAKAYKNKRIPC